MRLKVVALVLVMLSLLGMIPGVTAASSAFVYEEKFDYSTTTQMQAAGWTVNQPADTTFNGGALVLNGLGQDVSVSYAGFPSGISDWRAEARGRWTGGAGGNVLVSVNTNVTSYIWSVDGYYNQFAYYVGSAKVMQFGSVTLQKDQWVVLSMQKVGNNISLFYNGAYINSYAVTGYAGQAVGMSIVSPWQGVAEYDHIKLEAAPEMTWQHTYGGAASDVGYSAAAAADGGYAILGVTNSFGNGGNDAYLVRTDANGEELWNRTYGTSSGEWTYGIRATTDGGFIIVGATSYSGSFKVYLVKVAANGDEQWNRSLGTGPYSVGFAVAQTADGGYAVTGYRGSSNTATDVYLLRVDPSGAVLWERTFGGTGDDWGKAIVQMKDGGFGISGWTKSFGGVVKAYLIRTDSAGNELWQRTYGGSGSSYGYGVIEAADGGLLLGGYTDTDTHGGSDVLVVRTDTNGNMIWNHTYGGAKEETGAGIFPEDDGYIISGTSTSYSTLSRIYLVRTDLNGTERWAGAYGPEQAVSGVLALRTGAGYLIVGAVNNDAYVALVAGAGAGAQAISVKTIDPIAQAAAPVGAVVLGSGLGLLAILFVSRGGDASLAMTGGKLASWWSKFWTWLNKVLPVDKVVEFLEGYGKSHAKALLMRKERQVTEATAVERAPFLAGFSFHEVLVMAITSLLLGIAFMVANKLALFQPDMLLVYVLVAGFAVILHDLMHRFVAWRYNATTEYKFWGMGTLIMFATSIVFGIVYAMPARTIVNDQDKLTKRQNALVSLAGPAMSFAVFAVFLMMLPLGGWATSIALLGGTMNLMSAVYSMMPFDPMDGKGVYKWRRAYWALSFVPMFALYMVLMVYVF